MATKNMDNSNPRLLISEVLRKVSNAKTKDEKIQILHRHNSQALRSLLIWNFDDSVVSMLPEGDVPYTPNDAPVGTDHTRLEQEYKGLYRFVKGGADKLPGLKRESLFVKHHSTFQTLTCVQNLMIMIKHYKKINTISMLGN